MLSTLFALFGIKGDNSLGHNLSVLKQEVKHSYWGVFYPALIASAYTSRREESCFLAACQALTVYFVLRTMNPKIC